MSNAREGRIITFYSYKGGTGRSMALANVAWILAASGKKILAIDWDLEAPGLHRYFHPFLRDKELTRTPGLIDLFLDFVREATVPSEPNAASDDQWFFPLADVQRYAISLETDLFPAAAKLDFLAAGQQAPEYSERVNLFNWERFYSKLGSGIFLEAMKQKMRAAYDYILVDSRTGVSDSSGVCTVQMPDTLVVFFTYNTQSVNGASIAAESAFQQRSRPDGSRGLTVVPVPTRVDVSEHQKLEIARDYAHKAFEPVLANMSERERQSYWGQIEVLYHPYYAYEEVLATFGDRPALKNSMLSSMEAIARRITAEPDLTFPPLPEGIRKATEKRYTRLLPERSVADSAGPRYWMYISYARGEDAKLIRTFVSDLGREVSERVGSSFEDAISFLDVSDIAGGSDWNHRFAQAMASSRVALSLYSPRYFASVQAGKEFAFFRRADIPILPVVWVPSVVPRSIADIQYTSPEFPDSYLRWGMSRLMRLNAQRDDYHRVLFTMADRIVDLGSAERSPQSPPSIDDLENAFVDQALGSAEISGPRLVHFGVIAPLRSQAVSLVPSAEEYGIARPEQWRPFAGQGSLAAILSEIAANRGYLCKFLEVNPDLLERMKIAAGLNNLVLLIVDPVALHIPGYVQLLEEIDVMDLPNIGIGVLWNKREPKVSARPADLGQAMIKTFAVTSREADTGRLREVDTFKDLERFVIESLQQLTSALLDSKQISTPPDKQVDLPKL